MISKREQLSAGYPLESIEHVIAGDAGTPVLFLHGWGGDATIMKSLTEPISAQRKTISISMPGFGNSPEPPEDWGTWDYVEIVHQWLIANQFKKVDIIGHSFGGRVAIGLAHRYPESVIQMILIGSAGLVLPRSLKVRTKLLIAKSMNSLGNIVGDDINNKLQARKIKMASADWQAASHVMRRILVRVIREDLTAELREIKAKTLLIWGSDDSAVPVKLARRMNDLISHSKLSIISGAGHYPFLDEPGKTLTAVWEWLELESVW